MSKSLGANPGSRPSDQAPSGLGGSRFDPEREDDPIVGHKTWADGSHTPLRQSEAAAMWEQAEAERERRHKAMPDERAAISQLWDAQERLKELGWKDPVYAPKDGSSLDIIELGSTGIHRGHYQGEWPNGSWWIYDGDVWPSRPALARAAIATEARRAETPKSGSVHEGAGPQDIAQKVQP